MAKSWILLVLWLSMIAIRSQAESDTQLWLDLDVGEVSSEQVQINGRQSFRFKDDVSTLKTFFTELALTHRTSSWLDLRATYRHQFDKVADIEWIQESRPFADATLKWRWGRFSMANRSRLEYRIREERADEFRFRNRLTELIDLPLTPIKLRPYFAQEIFLDEEDSWLTEASRFRAFMGVRADPEDRFLFVKMPPKEGRRLKVDAYVMYEDQELEESTVNTFAVGFKFGVVF